MTKEALAREVVEYGSAELGLSDIIVMFKSEDVFAHPGVEAVFEPNMYVICFNVDWMEDASYEDVIRVALHETRHAYQKANIDFPEHFIGCEDNNTVDAWKKAMREYSVPYGDYEDYNNQILEKDANEFAMNKAQRILCLLDSKGTA